MTTQDFDLKILDRLKNMEPRELLDMLAELGIPTAPCDGDDAVTVGVMEDIE